MRFSSTEAYTEFLVNFLGTALGEKKENKRKQQHYRLFFDMKPLGMNKCSALTADPPSALCFPCEGHCLPSPFCIHYISQSIGLFSSNDLHASLSDLPKMKADMTE